MTAQPRRWLSFLHLPLRQQTRWSLGSVLSADLGPHQAVVTRVKDGDTFCADITVGHLQLAGQSFDLITRDHPVRLLGCNAAAKSTPGGAAAAAYVEGILTPGLTVTLTKADDYKYGNQGEIVAAVTLPDGTDLVSMLIAKNWVAPWDGRGPQPVPTGPGIP